MAKMKNRSSVKIEESGLMSRKQVADYLQVTLRTVDRMVDRKVLAKICIGRLVRFKREEVVGLVDAESRA